MSSESLESDERELDLLELVWQGSKIAALFLVTYYFIETNAILFPTCFVAFSYLFSVFIVKLARSPYSDWLPSEIDDKAPEEVAKGYETCRAQCSISFNKVVRDKEECCYFRPLPNLCENKDEDPAVLVDPLCSATAPQQITFSDITSAAFKIKAGIIRTPCVKSQLSGMTEMDIYLKKDFLQVTGSFKERGACYALTMLSEEQRQHGVISASLGNHALALCYHGKKLDIHVTVIMPLVAPIMKIQACRQQGAEVIVKGNDMKEAKYYAMKLAKEKGYTYINGYDHPHIIAGQGTLGLEIAEQVKDIDAVIVPIGGGGLIAGVALAVKNLDPKVKVIGVESEKCSSFTEALKHGKPVSIPIESTLADGLAVPMVGYNAFATARPIIDKVVQVKEEWIAIAILRLVELEKCVVEGAGAAGLAAILAGELKELKGKKVVLPLCGGNIDTTILGRCLERGLAVDGRLVKFTVTVSDRPGGIADLCRLVRKTGVSIKDIIHERAWTTCDVFSVQVTVVCETMDKEHANKLRRVLSENYTQLLFGDSMNPWTQGI